MEEPTGKNDSPMDPASRPRMSLPARLLNVFAVPGEVFGELKTAPAAFSNWLVPAVFGAVIGVISVFIVLSQPTIQQQFRERQTKIIEDRAKSGKMTPQEVDLAEKLTGPTFLKFAGGAGAVLGSFGSLFWWAFILWLLSRAFLKAQVSFSKALEVAGLAMMINVLGGIVAVLLIANLGRIGATPSLALVVKDFDVTRKGHLFAAAANVFSFWVVGVRAIGLAKLANVPYLRAAWLVFAFWVMEQSFFIVTGLGQLAM
jgi:hypothetical protein